MVAAADRVLIVEDEEPSRSILAATLADVPIDEPAIICWRPPIQQMTRIRAALENRRRHRYSSPWRVCENTSLRGSMREFRTIWIAREV